MAILYLLSLNLKLTLFAEVSFCVSKLVADWTYDANRISPHSTGLLSFSGPQPKKAFFGRQPQQGRKSCRLWRNFIHLYVCPSSPALLAGPQTPLAGLQAPQIGSHAPLAHPQAPLTGTQAALTGPQMLKPPWPKKRIILCNIEC